MRMMVYVYGVYGVSACDVYVCACDVCMYTGMLAMCVFLHVTLSGTYTLRAEEGLGVSCMRTDALKARRQAVFNGCTVQFHSSGLGVPVMTASG